MHRAVKTDGRSSSRETISHPPFPLWIALGRAVRIASTAADDNSFWRPTLVSRQLETVGNHRRRYARETPAAATKRTRPAGRQLRSRPVLPCPGSSRPVVSRRPLKAHGPLRERATDRRCEEVLRPAPRCVNEPGGDRRQAPSGTWQEDCIALTATGDVSKARPSEVVCVEAGYSGSDPQSRSRESRRSRRGSSAAAVTTDTSSTDGDPLRPAVPAV